MRCDRCGGKGKYEATKKVGAHERTIVLCERHLPEHEEALKKQEFTVTEIKELEKANA